MIWSGSQPIHLEYTCPYAAFCSVLEYCRPTGRFLLPSRAEGGDRVDRQALTPAEDRLLEQLLESFSAGTDFVITNHNEGHCFVLTPILV